MCADVSLRPVLNLKHGSFACVYLSEVYCTFERFTRYPPAELKSEGLPLGAVQT